MKKILTLILFVPFVANAQFQVSLNVGAAYTDRPHSSNLIIKHNKMDVSPIAVVDANYLHDNWIVGMRFNYVQLRTQNPTSDILLGDNTKSGKSIHTLRQGLPETFGPYKTQLGSCVLGAGVQAGRRFQLTVIDVNLMANLMYLQPIGNFKYESSGKTYESDGIYPGYSVGVSAGVNIHLTKNLGLPITLHPSYHWIDKSSYNGFILPASLGISYTIK